MNFMLLKLKLMRKDSILSIFKLVDTIKKQNKKNMSISMEFKVFMVI
jgi:hypothetical protein